MHEGARDLDPGPLTHVVHQVQPEKRGAAVHYLLEVTRNDRGAIARSDHDRKEGNRAMVHLLQVNHGEDSNIVSHVPWFLGFSNSQNSV